MEGFFAAFQYLLTPLPLFWMVLGTSLGIVVGAIPGLTGAMLIALSLPLTFHMPYADALVLLVSMYVGSISGGLITATLLRMPGTPASMMTTLDGYPMAQRGEPGRALGLGIAASFVGGIISWGFLVVLAEPMAQLSLRLDAFDTFALVCTALVLIASVAGDSLVRGILAGLLGILLRMPGASPATGQPRLTFGWAELDDGLSLLPVLIGLFAVGQIIHHILSPDESRRSLAVSRKGMILRWQQWKEQGLNLIRSSVIGTCIGILPGIGANIGSVVAYSMAKNFSKTPEEFGQGCDEGIVASEAANNATVGGALIPLISMGIPGSVIDAILLGALVIHNLQPGPLLFRDNPDVVYTIMVTVLLANIFMFGFMIATVGWLARLINVPRWLLMPMILVFCVVGSYALHNRMFDVWVMLAMGLFGYALERCKIPLAPFVIGFVLGNEAERNLSEGLMLSAGSYAPLVNPARPAFYFLLIAAVLFLWPVVRGYQQRRTSSTAGSSETNSA